MSIRGVAQVRWIPAFAGMTGRYHQRAMPRTGCDSYDDLPPDPLAVFAAWPVDRPVVMLHSGDSDAVRSRWGRWSILASPERWITLHEHELAGEDALSLIKGALEQSRDRHGARNCDPTRNTLPYGRGSDAPFSGGWIGFLSYELGYAIEPAARGEVRAKDDCDWPLYAFARVSGALVFDHVEMKWTGVGDRARVDDLVRDLVPAQSCDGDWRAGDLRSSMTPDAYISAVQRTLEYIGAGDIFQTNITQRFGATFEGSTRALAAVALAGSAARYGAYLEIPGGRRVVSMSPELFLEVRASGEGAKPQAAGGFTVTTRPIKGTRPVACDPRELLNSEKDAAELHMIVDLMRNDLGRVCEYGSVRVPVPRSIETYPSSNVHHGVAEIIGTLRPDATIVDLLRATFPAGSITGAPKIRAMQIIDELEPMRRGPYCGAIGFIGDDGSATLNVAIRTIELTGREEPGRCDLLREGALAYGAGGGIVADSNPADEYEESIVKAHVLRAVLGRAEPCAAERLPSVSVC